MKSKIIIILTFSLFLFACKNKSSENTDKEITSQEVHHHDNENNAIALNNGKKWKVDDSMMIHIHNMENDINSFEAKSVNDYPIIAEKLKNNIELLTSN